MAAVNTFMYVLYADDAYYFFSLLTRVVSVSLLVRRVHETQYLLVIVLLGGAPRGGYTALLVNYKTENVSTGYPRAPVNTRFTVTVLIYI